MLCKLICLYDTGVPIEKSAWATTPSHTGNLIVEDWLEAITFSTFKRVIRQARLLSTNHKIATDIIPPLFEPQIIKMTSHQMTFVGHQVGGQGVHYLQSWVIQIINA